MAPLCCAPQETTTKALWLFGYKQQHLKIRLASRPTLAGSSCPQPYHQPCSPHPLHIALAVLGLVPGAGVSWGWGLGTPPLFLPPYCGYKLLQQGAKMGIMAPCELFLSAQDRWGREGNPKFTEVAPAHTAQAGFGVGDGTGATAAHRSRALGWNRRLVRGRGTTRAGSGPIPAAAASRGHGAACAAPAASPAAAPGSQRSLPISAPLFFPLLPALLPFYCLDRLWTLVSL